MRGRVAISPPLTQAEYESDPLIAAEYSDFAFVISEEDVPYERNGMIETAFVRRAVALVPRSQERFSYYDFPENLEEFVKRHPSHEFNGTILRVGEENGDVERVIFEGREFKNEQATLTWHDGTKVEI